MKKNTPRKFKVLILFYSFTGQTEKLVGHIASGAMQIPGTEVMIRRIPEYINPELFQKNPKLSKIKSSLEKKYQEATIHDLTQADGVIIGGPVHFGAIAGQIKMFLDQFSPIWTKNAMVNKPVAAFVSGGSLHAGEELALLSMLQPFIWLGMVPVGIPYPLHNVHEDFDAGSPLGALFVSGHRGEKKLSADDKKVAQILGGRLAAMTQILMCGCTVATNAIKQFEKM